MPQRLAVAKTYKLYINGNFPRSESGRSLPIADHAQRLIAHVAHASRKDLRDAVEAAVAAQPKWVGLTAYNRAQILYRMAEMLEGKRTEFAEATRLQKSYAKHTSEVDAAIDRVVSFAGWADKFAQVLGCSNPVSGPYYNFTIPEPTGVVAVISPPISSGSPTLLAIVSLLMPVICAGNTAVLLASENSMIPAAILGEVCATCDIPAGVINILTGVRSELLDHIARHRNINAISAANLAPEEAAILKRGSAENLKRVHIQRIAPTDWHDDALCCSPRTIEPFVELKTIWHPMAV